MIQAARETWARYGGRELLRDYVRRLEGAREGRRAVHVALSLLPPSHRKPHHLHAATAGIASLAQGSRGHLFTLDNADLVVIYGSEAQEPVETEVQTLLKMLGATAPLRRNGSGGELVSWLDLETGYERFVALVSDAGDADDRLPEAQWEPVSAKQGSPAIEGKTGTAATRETVSRLSQALRNADLSNLLRRQAVYALGRQMYPRPLFREFYYSIPELGEAVLPRENLTANTFLFRHATKTLDKVMLSSLMRNKKERTDPGISINLNLSTILSGDFAKFDESMDEAGRNGIIIEIQCADIVSEAKAYARARAFLRERGYRICLDGITPPALKLVDSVCSGVEFVKIYWHPELVGLAQKDRAGLLLKPRSGKQPRLVITRAGTPAALAFGQSLGIDLFQGRYIDAFAEKDRRWREMVRLNRGFQAGH